MYFIDPEFGNYTVAALKTIKKQTNKLRSNCGHYKKHSSKSIRNKQTRADVRYIVNCREAVITKVFKNYSCNTSISATKLL